MVNDIADCYFHHTMDVPGFGHVEGLSDLRGRQAQYLGSIPLKGKRVLEIARRAASCAFYRERQGAEVVVYDLSHEQDWNMVPYSRLGDEAHRQSVSQRREHIRRLNNSFWLAHRANGSRARVVYGSVYEISKEIGEVDVSVFGSVRLHVRDPF